LRASSVETKSSGANIGAYKEARSRTGLSMPVMASRRTVVRYAYRLSIPAAPMSIIAPSALAAPRTERTATAMFMLGTPHASWESLARAVLVGDDRGRNLLDNGLSAWLDRVLGIDATQWGVLAADEQRWKAAFGDAPRGGVDVRLCWALEALNKCFPHSRYLVFVDTPVRALARWIAGGGPGGVEQALDLWCAGAQRLLRHAHRHPQRVLMVASDEVEAWPQALSGPLQEHFGMALGEVPVMPGDDPMAVSLASALVAGRLGVLGLYEELLATCVPLSQDDVSVQRSSVAWREDVVRLYREGRQAQERERANACALLLQLHATEEAIESQTVTDRERSAQLARVQGRESHLRNELAKHEERAKQARHREETLQREVAAKAKAAEELVAAKTKAAGELVAVQQKLTKAEAQAQARAAEGALLQTQVEQLQVQLRSHHAELEKIRRGGSVSSFSYRSVEFGAVHDQPPHCHVDVLVRRAQWPGRTKAQMTVRLVEHGGLPGLVLFEEDGRTPISGWQTGGQERGRNYMVLIPQDAAGAQTLRMLGSADWIAVTGIVQMLEVELGNKPFATAPRWRSVATRLRLLLADLPPRLRYDTAAMCSAPEVNGRLAIDVQVDDALFGSQALGTVHLRWLLGGPRKGQPALRWLLTPGGGRRPPLAHWPLQKNGQVASELIVPVGTGLDTASKRAAWAAFSAQEQGIVLGLLDALPACAAATGAGLLPPGWDAKRLAASAKELRDEAHRRARSVRLRHLVRRVLRRAV
jgi:hypothetical protein